LTKKILLLINDKRPQSVKELSDILKQQNGLTENEILFSILKLQAEGSINLKDLNVKNSFGVYLVSTETIWYWVTIAIGVFASLLFFFISETAYPLIYIRNIMGFFLVLFLPGYVLVRILFPINVTAKTQNKQIQAIQRVALSLGTSAVLVTIIGLFVYNSPWGLDLSLIIVSLLGLTLVLSTTALVNEYRIKNTNLLT
jgi:uncharacterized membrane protein